MADIFLSYARADTARAIVIKDALEALGLTVFFDTEGLDSGDIFPDVLDREVKSAGAVVSVWTNHAINRPWVKKECAIGLERRVLIPVQIEPISNIEKPVAFADLQITDLEAFTGQADHIGWQRTVRALARTLKRPDLIKARKTQEKEEARAAKLEAELEKQKARNKTLAKKKRGGLGWKGGLAVMTAVLIFGGGAAKFAIDWQAEQTRNRLIPPAVRAELEDPRTWTQHSSEAVSNILARNDIVLTDLVQAAGIDPDAAFLAGSAYDNGSGGQRKIQ